MKKLLWFDLAVRTWDGEDEAAAAAKAKAEADAKAAEEAEKSKKFDQAAVDAIVAKRVNEYKAQLAELEKNKSITEQQRKEIEGRLDQVKKEKDGELETLRAQLGTTQKQAAEEKKALEEQAKSWRTRFTSTLVQNEVSTAAAKHGAFDGGDLHKMIRDDIVVNEDVDDKGKGIGTFKVQVKKMAEGKEVLVSVDDFVAQFKTQKPQFFRSGKSGVGADHTNGGTGNSGALKDMTPEQKKEYFKKQAQAKK